MKTYLDCYPCFIRNALEGARIANQDETIQKQVLTEVMGILKEMDLEASPPRLAQVIHRRIREVIGIRDPYVSLKREQNTQMLHLEPRLTDHVMKSPKPLTSALKLAGACNAIDVGPTRNWNRVEELLDQLMNPSVGRFDLEAFKMRISTAENILYIGDNAGEIVGDKILLSILREQTKMDNIFVVRGGPILNDATLEDASSVGIDKLARVITTGTDCPGVILSECSHDFRETFKSADLILAKGQGNYESLEEEGKDIFFLLQVKCPIVARDLKSEVGDIVLHFHCP